MTTDPATVRALAWRRILAATDNTAPADEFHAATRQDLSDARDTALQAVAYDAQQLSVTDAQIDAEELDIRRRHFTADTRTKLLGIGRRYLAALHNAGPNGPPPGAEDCRTGTAADCPDDGIVWPDNGDDQDEAASW